MKTRAYDHINLGTYALVSEVAAEDIADAQPLFSVYDYENHIYERNPDCWLNLLEPGLTPYAVWNSAHDITGGPVLVSPIHVMTAAHVGLPPGTQVKFVTSDNEVITRTVVDVWSLSSGWVGAYNDISVSLLDEAVPDEIGYFKVLPGDLTSLMPIPEGYLALPAIEINRLRVSGIECITTLGEDPATLPAGRNLNYTDINFTTSWLNAITYGYNEYASLFNQWEVAQGGGDSGNPLFVIIDQELVLLTFYSTVISGVAVNYHIDDVNEAMADIQGGDDPYQLSVVDLDYYRDAKIEHWRAQLSVSVNIPEEDRAAYEADIAAIQAYSEKINEGYSNEEATTSVTWTYVTYWTCQFDLAIPWDIWGAIPNQRKTAFQAAVAAMVDEAIGSSSAVWHVCRHETGGLCGEIQDI